MPSRMITEETLGAWLIKCDPESKYDLLAAMDDGQKVVDNWSVVDNYRSQMMKAGQRVILWVSGNGRRLERGIWGIGWLAGPAHDAHIEELGEDEVSYWHSEEDRLAVTNSVEMYVPLFDEAVTAGEIVAAGITDLEVQKQAQGSNPSWVSKEQLTRLAPLLGEWPDEDAVVEQIIMSEHGAGFGDDPFQRQVVESAAMEAVEELYGDDWRSHDVSDKKVGWDITFEHETTGEIAKVEVKGLSGDRPQVLLTANEVRAAQEEPDWVLAVVTRALSKPNVVEYTADQALAAAQPYVFKADLSDGWEIGIGG